MPKTVQLEVDIIYTRRFRFRMWLAARLVLLAGWVMGCSIKVNEGGQQDD